MPGTQNNAKQNHNAEKPPQKKTSYTAVLHPVAECCRSQRGRLALWVMAPPTMNSFFMSKPLSLKLPDGVLGPVVGVESRDDGVLG